MTEITRQDLVDALKNHPRANDAIFWFCHAWHQGGDDLYRIMCRMSDYYTPRPWSYNPMVYRQGKPVRNKNYDPELAEMLEMLAVKFHKVGVVTPPLFPVMRSDVHEGHVLTADGTLSCVMLNWPCRVYPWRGKLSVECSGAAIHGIELKAGSETYHHPLEENRNGYVIGFNR